MSKLNAATAATHELIDWPTPQATKLHFGVKFGIVDLETITPEQADRLIRMGFKKLKRKELPAEKPKPPKDAENTSK